MSAVMLDTCVLLDVVTEDPEWFEWSAGVLRRTADAGAVVVNPVIYSELSVGFDRIEDVEALLNPDVFQYRPIPREAAFLAAKCFQRYRQRGGTRTTPLPDFLIGAHASVESLPLATRDASRFRTCFPRLALIHP